MELIYIRFQSVSYTHLDVYKRQILWLRVRIEGSTLKVVIQEKINPPQTKSYEYGNLVASKDGEVKRVYTFAGRSACLLYTSQI